MIQLNERVDPTDYRAEKEFREEILHECKFEHTKAIAKVGRRERWMG